MVVWEKKKAIELLINKRKKQFYYSIKLEGKIAGCIDINLLCIKCSHTNPLTMNILRKTQTLQMIRGPRYNYPCWLTTSTILMIRQNGNRIYRRRYIIRPAVRLAYRKGLPT